MQPHDTTTEEWKDIPGLEGRYQASSLGRVRSLARTIERTSRRGKPMQQHWPTRVLRQCITGRSPYPVVGFINGERRHTKVEVHRLVAAAFLGAPPEGYHVHHIDGDKTNNRVDNLRYELRVDHVRIHLEGKPGTPNKLQASDIPTIRALLELGTLPQHQIAGMFGVEQTCISAIKTGKIWTHVG